MLVSFAFLKPKYLTCLLTLNSSLDSSWVALLKRKAWFQNSVLSSSRSHKIELGRRFLWYCCRLVDNKYSRPLENKQAGSSAQTTTTTQATQFDAYAPISVATELDRYWVITRASSLLRPRPPPYTQLSICLSPARPWKDLEVNLIAKWTHMLIHLHHMPDALV